LETQDSKHNTENKKDEQHRKLKGWTTRIPSKTGVNPGAPEG
jgi:hypothetical protein